LGNLESCEIRLQEIKEASFLRLTEYTKKFLLEGYSPALPGGRALPILVYATPERGTFFQVSSISKGREFSNERVGTSILFKYKKRFFN